jgi:hypothetical protein
MLAYAYLQSQTAPMVATQARCERVVPPGSFDRAAFIELARDSQAWIY